MGWSRSIRTPFYRLYPAYRQQGLFVPDAGRESGARTMMGGLSDFPFNGTVRGASRGTVPFARIRTHSPLPWEDTDLESRAAYQQSVAGGFVTVLRNGRPVSRARILAPVVGHTNRLDIMTDMSNDDVDAIQEGDTYAVNAIPFEATAWQVNSSADPTQYEMDLFRRKKTVGMSVKLSDVSGDTENAQFNHELWGDDNRSPIASMAGPIETCPDQTEVHTENAAGPILRPGWSQYSSNVDLKLLGAKLVNIIEGSHRSSAAPVGD